jgi:hypothetical protein
MPTAPIGGVVRDIQVMHSHTLESKVNASLERRHHYGNMSVMPTVRRPSPTVGVGTAIG